MSIPEPVVRYSIPTKQDKLRAVHCKPGPIGTFIHGILTRGGEIVSVVPYQNKTLRIVVLLPEDKIKDFEETTGFGLTE